MSSQQEIKEVGNETAKAKPAVSFLVPLLSLLVLALALRLPGLTWGLPNAQHWYSYHPDEYQIRNAVIALFDERNTNFNPHFFNYPSLFIYLTYFAYLVLTILGLGTPMAGDAPWPGYHDVILAGRLTSALLGVLTIPAVYFIGRRLSGEKIGLLAAFLMAVAPGHVQHSHFATVDVAATFFVAWSLFFAVRGAAEARSKDLLFAAFIAGLAAATKYNAGLVVIAPLAVLWTGQFGRKAVMSCGAIGLALLGFLLGCPHSLVSTTEFLGNRTDSGFLYELLVHPRQGHGDIFINTGNGWLYHLTFNLPFAFTAPGALCGVVGCVCSARAKNKLWLPLLIFAALYFLTLGLSQVRFMRYLLPLLPVLCLAVPLCLQLMPRSVRKIGAGALALLMFIGATNVLYPFCVPDPRDQAAAYTISKVERPQTFALIEHPWFWTPPLWPQDYPPGSGSRSNEGVSPDGNFRFNVTGFDAQKLTDLHPDFILKNEFEWRERVRLRDSTAQNFLQTQPDPGQEEHFKNHAPLALPGRSFVPHDFLYSNPEQRVYSKNKPVASVLK